MGTVSRRSSRKQSNLPIAMSSNGSCYESSRKLSCVSEDSPSMSDCLIICGKVHLENGDIHQAISDLSDACEIVSIEFGETAPECGEAYLYYGKALLELSKMEGDVLDNALNGFDVNSDEGIDCNPQIECPEGLSTEEKWDIEDKVADAIEEHFEKIEEMVNIHMGITDSDEDWTDEENSDATDDQDSGSEEDVKVVEEEEHNNADDIGNLEAAWEVLELARLALSKSKSESKVCKAILCLGEVSFESGNYSLAVEDFRDCLERSKAVYPADSRFIAEVHFQLGLSLGHLGQMKEAESSLSSAISVLRSRIAQLEGKGGCGEEVKELGEVIVDIEKVMEENKTEGSTAVLSKSGEKPVVEGVEGNLSKLVKDGCATGPATA